MKRVNQFARLAVVFIFIAVSAVAQSGLPRLTISIYAVEPKDAPLLITNFQYRQGSIDLVVHNDSAKIVTDFSIYAWVATPPGCPVEENQNGKPSRHAWLGRNIHLTIKSQETVTLTRQYQDVVLSPGASVSSAHSLQYAFLHVQAGISTVHFTDGTRWSPGVAGNLNPRIVDLDSGACSNLDTATILESLKGITGAGSRDYFRDPKAVIEMAQEPGNREIPHLLFSCSLDGSVARCPWD
ncbi:MAG TPA: hypothetical protein VN684_06200 [Terriglobales bacterium]|nr:hypothetical protein [Terriglobales bacterium]